MEDVSSFTQAKVEAISDIKQLQTEIELIKNQVVIPGWLGEHHGMPRTLYGYMMSCFSFVDLLSQYWEGEDKPNRSRGQTVRMVAFMDEYLDSEHLANSVAIQLWRHTLIHTANPKRLISADTEVGYRWLLHWGSP